MNCISLMKLDAGIFGENTFMIFNFSNTQVFFRSVIDIIRKQFPVFLFLFLQKIKAKYMCTLCCKTDSETSSYLFWEFANIKTIL